MPQAAIETTPEPPEAVTLTVSRREQDVIIQALRQSASGHEAYGRGAPHLSLADRGKIFGEAKAWRDLALMIANDMPGPDLHAKQEA
jgi:hypothetical protein